MLPEAVKPYLGANKAQLLLSATMAPAAIGSWAAANYRVRGLAANHAIDLFVLILASTYLARLAYAALFVHQAYGNAYYYVAYPLLAVMAGPYLLSRAAWSARTSWRRPSGALATQIAAGVGALLLVALSPPWAVATLSNQILNRTGKASLSLAPNG